MKICTTKNELTAHLGDLRKNKRTIGLVPTMGALHEGHLELVNASARVCDSTVCTIFVNPTQFNDPRDLANYPRTADEDIEKLSRTACDTVFMPSYEEMYGENEAWHVDLGELENVLEGKYRPGHFQGVTQIVYKLFAAVQPDTAFFGQKDFQQFQVIAAMVRKLSLPVKLVMCPIVREDNGLAMSSRNRRLSAVEQEQALALFQSLQRAGADFGKMPLEQVRSRAIRFLENAPGLELDYFETCIPDTLSLADDSQQEVIALAAARVGPVRLIDNLLLGKKQQA